MQSKEGKSLKKERVRPMKITGTGSSVWNPVAGGFGIAVGGKDGSGSVTQYNNGKADTYNVGSASKDGSIHGVICTDGQAGLDTINLGQGWHVATKDQAGGGNPNDVVDDATGIHGTLYVSDTGDQLLINGGAKVVPGGDVKKANDPNGTLNEEAENTKTLTTGGNFEATDADHKDGISLEEARNKLISTKDDTDANKALRKALTWLTTNGHFEMLSGGSDKGVTLQELQNAFLESSGSEGG